MVRSMRSQGVRCDLATEQQAEPKGLSFPRFDFKVSTHFRLSFFAPYPSSPPTACSAGFTFCLCSQTHPKCSPTLTRLCCVPCHSSAGQKGSLLLRPQPSWAAGLPSMSIPPPSRQQGTRRSTPHKLLCHLQRGSALNFLQQGCRGAPCQHCSHLLKSLPSARSWPRSANGVWPSSWLLKSMFK